MYTSLVLPVSYTVAQEFDRNKLREQQHPLQARAGTHAHVLYMCITCQWLVFAWSASLVWLVSCLRNCRVQEQHTLQRPWRNCHTQSLWEAWSWTWKPPWICKSTCFGCWKRWLEKCTSNMSLCLLFGCRHIKFELDSDSIVAELSAKVALEKIMK